MRSRFLHPWNLVGFFLKSLCKDWIFSRGVIYFFLGLFDLGPAASSISPALIMNFSKTSSFKMVSFKNFKYSKSLTEFFCPAALILVGRNPVVFHACYKLSLPDMFKLAWSLALEPAAPLLYLEDTPR